MKKQKNVVVNWSQLTKRLGKALRRPKRQMKDIVFRLIFGNDKKALLELYNALNGTNYTNADELQIVTLENVIYIEMKNDLAFILSGRINLYEHQSTVNPNMPVRFLIYLAEEYQMLLENVDQSIYGSSLVTLPTPQCIVFYNGIEPMEDEARMHLSDAFQNKEVSPSVEVIVRVININYGHNEELMKACSLLEQYSRFVEVMRECSRSISNQREAMNRAIDFCIENGILEEILRKNRGEILGSLLEEFDRKKYERTIREEGYESGREAGYESGKEAGYESGREVGYEFGREDTQNKIIRNMILKGKTDAEIISITECTKEEIEAIRREM